MTARVVIKPGVAHYPAFFDRAAQEALRDELSAICREASLFQPTMPRWGNPMSVRMLNLGPLGWVSDKSGYRYQARHPVTGELWPPIIPSLIAAWDQLADAYPAPEACLINWYSPTAKMGLHQDRDEADLNAPIVSLSLGDDALFRIGTAERGGPTQSFRLRSGDALVFGGPARLDFHGIDRIYPSTCTLLPEAGRINLTMRRVTVPS